MTLSFGKKKKQNGSEMSKKTQVSKENLAMASFTDFYNRYPAFKPRYITNVCFFNSFILKCSHFPYPVADFLSNIEGAKILIKLKYARVS